MGAPGGVPSSPVLAGIGRGRLFRSKAAVLQRFDGTAWRDVARYPTIRDADAALDHQVGEGQEPGALRVVEAASSRTTRALMIVGAVVGVAVAIAIVWIFVAGS